MVDYGLISVIVPVYNAEKYLKQCIDSVLAQTYPYYEIILVDDGSTDSSGQICDDYSQRFSNVTVFHKENGGASSARNYGLKRSSGDFLYFLDSDDWIIETALEKMIVCSYKNNADLVFIEATTINEKGEERTGKYDYHKMYLPSVPSETMSEMMDNKEFHVGTPFFFVRKDVFVNNQLFFLEGVMYEDILMSYQLFSLANRCAHVHEYIYIRRYRSNSVMTNKISERNFYSASKVYEALIDFSKILPKEKIQNKHIVRWSYNVMDIYTQLSRKDKKKYKKQYEQIISDIKIRNAFDDASLKVRCDGYLPWLFYKIKNKIFKKTLKDKSF